MQYSLAKYLKKEGINILIFTTNFGRKDARFPDEGDLKIIESDYLFNIGGLLYSPKMKAYLEEYRDIINLVHIHGFRTYQNVVAFNFCKKYEIPYIFQAHGSILKIGRTIRKEFYDKFFVYKILKNASKVIALSKTEAIQYEEMGVPYNKIVIIPNGIDLKQYQTLPEKGLFRKKYNLKNEKIILYLGRIHRNKGIDLIIKALENLVYTLGQRKVKLIIAGPDDGFLKEVKSLVTSLQLTEKVLFVGLLSEKDKIKAYVDSDIVVYPEKLNVFGMVPLEAAACCKPVVVSGENAVAKFVQEGHFGFVLKNFNVSSLSNLLDYAIKNKKMIERKGKGGLKYVAKNFDLKNITSRIKKLYMEVLKNTNIESSNF